VRIKELRQLLDQLADTRELIVRRPVTRSAPFEVWSDAREEARDAYRTWRASPTAESYAIYRAAQDREDAAQDTLARASRS
jgi:hypothetical protein